MSIQVIKKQIDLKITETDSSLLESVCSFIMISERYTGSDLKISELKTKTSDEPYNLEKIDPEKWKLMVDFSRKILTVMGTYENQGFLEGFLKGLT